MSLNLGASVELVSVLMMMPLLPSVWLISLDAAKKDAFIEIGTY